jgi:two-component system nitrate/nitrite response regulator NarL
MDQISVVGAELARESLKSLLAGSVFAVCHDARTLGEAHRLLCAAQAEGQRAQLLLVDFEGRLDGDEVEVLRAIRRDQPAVKVVMLGDFPSLGLLPPACFIEIDGYVLKEMSAGTLIHALGFIMSGQRIFPLGSHAATLGAHPTQEAPIAAKATNGLSARDAQILQLLISGSSNKAIAHDLAISHETVKIHIRALLRKLNAQNRTQAALWAHQNGFREVTA